MYEVIGSLPGPGVVSVPSRKEILQALMSPAGATLPGQEGQFLHSAFKIQVPVSCRSRDQSVDAGVASVSRGDGVL